MNIQEMEAIVKKSLENIEHPTYRLTLAEIGMFHKIEDEDGKIKVYLKTPDDDRKVQISIESQLRGILYKEGFPKGFKIKFELDESIKPEEIGNSIRGIKNILLIGSGKGGVGKSTITANLAVTIAQNGFKVGILDADIYGPSIGKMFGYTGRVPLYGDGKNKVYPLVKYNVKIMSFSFLLEEGQAVIWRGPMLGKAMEQFLFEVEWGDLDYLLIDLPPGTGDVQLSLAQYIEVEGAVIVTTPQNVAIQDASRALSMFNQVKIPVLGIIENMSGFLCPHCGNVSYIFSKDGAKDFAKSYNVPLLGTIPLETRIMEAGEEGNPLNLLKDPNNPIAQSYNKIFDNIQKEIEKYKF